MELEHERDSFDSNSTATTPTKFISSGRQDGPMEVVPLHNDSPIDSMTDVQKKKVDRFYELLANAMPLEGRDYVVEFESGEDGLTVLARVVGKNDLGKSFSRQVAEYWKIFGIH